MGNQQGSPNVIDLIPIPESDGYFSDWNGDIYSTKRSVTPKRLSSYEHKGRSSKPYLRVRFGEKLMLVHRIVAQSIIGRKLLSTEQVNHIDGDTLNNAISNLEVVSHRDNIRHAVLNGLYCSGDAWYAARGICRNAGNLQRLVHGVQNGQ